jgi:hypothetical protein
MKSVTERARVVLALTIALAACGGESAGAGDAAAAGDADETSVGKAAANETGSAEGSGYTVTEVTNGGTIRGVVSFEGAVPPPETVASTEDADVCGERQEVQLLEVDGDGGLANAIVSLVDIEAGAALEVRASPPALDQRDCRFSPHVLIAAADAPVAILNSDPIMHNVHTLTFENRAVNRSQPPGVRKIELSFPRPEKVKVRCDVHEWMSAWIVAVDHPYHAVTSGDGSFVIENVPPGTYTLEVWHEALGSTTRSVSVAPGETTEEALVISGTES